MSEYRLLSAVTLERIEGVPKQYFSPEEIAQNLEVIYRCMQMLSRSRQVDTSEYLIEDEGWTAIQELRYSFQYKEEEVKSIPGLKAVVSTQLF